MGCILDLAREGRCIAEGAPPTSSQVWAISQDLRFVESLLSHISSYEEESSDDL